MRSIVIVGGGFSGTMVAVHLLRGAPDTSVTLVERTGQFGRGAAYGTACLDHVLNVPAARMSAYPDRPDHFFEWARARDPDVLGGSFVPRARYGAYIAEQLDEAERAAPGRLKRVCGQAVSAERNDRGFTVSVNTCAGAISTHIGDAMVLALGNYAPANPPLADPSFYESSRYTRDPWAMAPSGAHRGDVLLIGTGLTMLDIALELSKDPSVGAIHAISRRGLLPEPHRTPGKPAHYDPPASAGAWPATALGMLRGLRREVREAASRGVDWREVVTSIRPITQTLWKRLPMNERARFLSHIRPYWEVVRHRSAPAPFAALGRLIEAGRLTVHAGRLVELRDQANEVSVRFRPRAGGAGEIRTLRVARVINCTGPESDCRRIDDPMIQSLLRAGLIRPDPLGIGLGSDEHGALLDASGKASSRLWLAGPLLKATLWEATAVPELREHAQRLAERLSRPSACG